MHRIICRINKIADRILFAAVGFFTGALFVVLLLSVVSRYLARRPILPSIELTRLLFIWACFFAASITYRRKAHIAFEAMTDRLPGSVRRRIKECSQVLIIIFCCIIFASSLQVIVALWPTTLPMLGISQGWFYIPVPVVCALITLQTIEMLIERFGCRQDNSG